MEYRLLTVLSILAVGVVATVPEPDYVKFVDLASEEMLTLNSDHTYRLSQTVLPIQYNIKLTPYFNTDDDKRFTFEGVTTIVIRATERSIDEFTVHSADQIILEITVVETADIGVTDHNLYSSHSIDENFHFLKISLEEAMSVGSTYTVTITYTGNIQGDHLMRGFYRSWFKDDNGDTRWMGATQFQPGHARRAFPCFDEPFFKAVFTITIVNPINYISISNMPVASTTTTTVNEEERETNTFYPTPIMSTYLIAFIVAEYVPHNIIAGERPFGVYARENAKDNDVPQGEYAFNTGIDLVEAMEEYTDYSYYEMDVNMKMDQAALPDFSAGAMENWGLLTYREALILYNEDETSSFYKQRIANIISHEVAHMWFGNLVTCDWWNDLWLNEGFARYYQYFLTNKVEAGMEFHIKYVVEQVNQAMLADSLVSSRALTYEANSPAEVTARFDAISYSKGSAIIRMMEYFVGDTTFVKGLQNYLKNNEFSTSLPSDLYTALDTAAAEDDTITRYGVTVANVMSTWVMKSGFPLITVSIDQSTHIMTITQNRFYRDSGIDDSNSDLYAVPLTFATEESKDWDNTTADHVLQERSITLDRGSTEPGWVIFNKKGVGYYRVNYDDDTWDRIFATLNDDTTIGDIDPLNRALIVDDLFQLARAGIISYEKLLNFLAFLKHETSYPVWINALSGFAFLQRRVAHVPDALQYLEATMLSLMEKVIAELGFEEGTNDTHLTRLLRVYIMQRACDLGHEQCVSEALRLYSAFNTTTPSTLPPNLRQWVYCTALQRGDGTTYDFLWTRFKNSNVYNEKIEILQILGCTNDASKLREYLSNIFGKDEDTGVRAQDVTTALSSVLTGNEQNTDIAYDWLQLNYGSIRENYYGDNGIATFTNSLAGRMITEAQIVALETWVQSNDDLAALTTSVAAAAASARSNLEWTDSRLDLISALKDEPDSAASVAVSALLVVFSVIFTLLGQ